MLEVSFDPDARSLYWYFTDIKEGDDADEQEVPGSWLIDGSGQIVGLRLALDDASPRLLEYARSFEYVSTDETTLTILIVPDAPVTEEELAYGAIVDLDAQGRALGLETPAMIEFGIGQRLERLAPHLVEWDDEESPEGDPEAETEADEAEQATEAPVPESDVRAGFVALVGKPNVGKSTLLNTLLGQKVSIVSPKPQTTRVPVRGILNSPSAQIVFVDTPGIHQPRHKLGNFMVEVARRAIPDADMVGFMVDISEPPTRADQEIAKLIRDSGKPTLLILNKVDATNRADVYLQAYRELGDWDAEAAISARDKLGLETLLELIVERLPLGPRLYPDDQLMDMNEREMVGELIREKIMLNTEQEIPHSVAVEVEEWEQRNDMVYIRANISVERMSQRGIIIGSGGAMLRKIGAAARYEIERMLGQRVYLDLWVKIRENWRQKPGELRWLGYDVKHYRG